MEFVRSLQQWGIEKSTFNSGIRTSVELFERLRNAVAHFDIRFISDTPEHLIDRIEFRDEEADMVVSLPLMAIDTSSLYYEFFVAGDLRRRGNPRGQFAWLPNSLVFSYTSISTFTTNISLSQIKKLISITIPVFCDAFFSGYRSDWGLPFLEVVPFFDQV